MSRRKQNNRGRQRRAPVAEMNVVPYIDVMLVLLIIFMIATPLLQTGVEVELPQADAEPVSTRDNLPLVVNVDKNGEYFLTYDEYQREAVDHQRLLVLVRAVLLKKPGTAVLVGGDKSVDYGRVVEVMARLQSAGVSRVGLLTQPEPGA